LAVRADFYVNAGKPREALNYAGGMPLYLKTINEVIDQDFKGFTVT